MITSEERAETSLEAPAAPPTFGFPPSDPSPPPSPPPPLPPLTPPPPPEANEAAELETQRTGGTTDRGIRSFNRETDFDSSTAASCRRVRTRLVRDRDRGELPDEQMQRWRWFWVDRRVLERVSSVVGDNVASIFTEREGGAEERDVVNGEFEKLVVLSVKVQYEPSALI